MILQNGAGKQKKVCQLEFPPKNGFLQVEKRMFLDP